jgi:hypothetical protein
VDDVHETRDGIEKLLKADVIEFHWLEMKVRLSRTLNESLPT